MPGTPALTVSGVPGEFPGPARPGPRQRVAGGARDANTVHVVPRRVAAADIARGKAPQHARRSTGRCARHVRVRPGCQRPDGGVVAGLDEVSGAADAGTEQKGAEGSPAWVRQNSTAASVASKWVATGGFRAWSARASCGRR